MFFGKTLQDGPCGECRRKASGPYAIWDPNAIPIPREDRKTPIPAPLQRLTPEQMIDLLVELLDTPEVKARLAEVVSDVLREKLIEVSTERRRGSYTVLNPDVTDLLEDPED